MAAKHPYVSTTGVLTQVLDQLRKSFPSTFNAETLKKLGFAPKNESYIINVVRFLGLISDTDAKTEQGGKVFNIHDDAAFQLAFAEVVQSAYKDLFTLHKDTAWTLTDDKLISFFRQSDQTSDLVGSRQAGTFKTLAAYAGHVQQPATTGGPRTSTKSTTRKTAPSKASKAAIPPKGNTAKNSLSMPQTSNFGLTVRIEINLPSTGDQGTYDKIFKSIRENFLNG